MTAPVESRYEPELFPDLRVAKDAKQRVAAPQDGISLERMVIEKGRLLREAVREIAAVLEGVVAREQFDAAFAPRFVGCPSPQLSAARLALRAAWNLVSVWLLARRANGEKRGLVDAEAWFGGGGVLRLSELIPAPALWRAEQLLGGLALDKDFWDLLPHLLEEHGAGSRASVMRDPGTKKARDAKRKDGVYYTPADVADYMVRQCAANAGGIGARACLDPACGTGVFLLALLHAAEAEADAGFDRFEFAARQLFGMDVSGHALDAGAFVLLHACWRDVERRGISAWAAWHRLRMKLVQVDALTVEAGGAVSPQADESFTAVTRELESDASRLVLVREIFASGDKWFGARGLSLGSIFPSAPEGFGLLVGNPPYAAIGEREDMCDFAMRFRSLPDGTIGRRANLFPLFIEMMWRLAAPGRSAAALVTPLSIAFHSGSQYENCRRAMSAAGGRWQFAFFDREPHALFGEEVKTRNAILFRVEDATSPSRGERAEIETGPLRKWTSRTRHALFDSIAFTPIGAESIAHGVPKLGGAAQAKALCVLRRGTGRLRSWCSRIGSCRPGDAVGEQEGHRVFVGGTAYNFLNVYRRAELADDECGTPMSESAVHCLQFRSDDDAAAAFAVLQSRVVYWLWHVWGDGFHVPGWLWDEIPFHRAMFDADNFARLSALGRTLWERLQAHRFTSLNAGKLTIGYRPLHCHEERDSIDVLLLASTGLSADFADELRTFVRGNAVVDATDARRQNLYRIFPIPQTA